MKLIGEQSEPHTYRTAEKNIRHIYIYIYIYICFLYIYIYVTRSGKTVHFALFTEVELLVSADAPFSTECGNTSFASFGRTVAKLRPRTVGTFADVRFWKSTFENCNENSVYFRIIITTVYLSCDYVIKFLRLRGNGDPRANKRRFASLIEST